MKGLFIGFILIFANEAFAAQLLQDDNITDKEAKKFRCIQQARTHCITLACQIKSPISENRDCQDICIKKAQERCDQQY